jgi:hypothetical protein
MVKSTIIARASDALPLAASGDDDAVRFPNGLFAEIDSTLTL